MKKQTIILLGFLFFTFLGYSQIKYNITLGINSSRFSDKFNTIGGKYLNTSSLGLSLGVSADLPVSNKISFYPKIIYNQIGDRDEDYDGRIAIDKFDYKLNYLSIPLNFKFFNKPYVLFGPQIGFLISQKLPPFTDFGKVDNKIDFGGNIGIGLPIKNFKIELIIYQSLTNVTEIKTNSYFGSEKFYLRNTYVNFNISYLIF